MNLALSEPFLTQIAESVGQETFSVVEGYIDLDSGDQFIMMAAPSDGHHPVPQQQIKNLQGVGLLTEAAVEVLNGTVTGQMDPNHLFGTYGGVSHRRYNELAQQLIADFVRREGITAQKPMTEEQARRLAQLAWNPDPDGPYADMGKFNRAIDGTVVGPGTIRKGAQIALQQADDLRRRLRDNGINGQGRGGLTHQWRALTEDRKILSRRSQRWQDASTPRSSSSRR